MEVYFDNDEIAEVAVSDRPHSRLYRSLPKEVIRSFHRAIRYIQKAKNINELYQIRSLNYEALKGDLKGLCSIRLGLKYRAIFYEMNDGLVIMGVNFVEINNHYD